MAITTVTNCKTFRGIAADNTEHDEELARLIPAVQGFLEKECGRVFDKATVTEFYNGAGPRWDDCPRISIPTWRDSLVVARPPIVSITNIWDDPLRVYSTPLDPSHYVIGDADAGIVMLDGLTFCRGLNNIKITYTGGFAVMPADLEQAAIEMVWAAREKGSNNLVGVRSRSIADGSIQFVNLDWGSVNLQPIVNRYSLHTGVA